MTMSTFAGRPKLFGPGGAHVHTPVSLPGGNDDVPTLRYVADDPGHLFALLLSSDQVVQMPSTKI